MSKIVKCISIYFILWLITWSALLADLQSINQCHYYRSSLGAAMFLAFMPPVWVMTPFVTGFYEHGFQIFNKCDK